MKTFQDEVSKPPLGLTPKWVRQEDRSHEIVEAMQRFLNAGQAIPEEWIDELEDIQDDLRKRWQQSRAK